MKKYIILTACLIIVFTISVSQLFAQAQAGVRTGTAKQKTGQLQVDDGTTGSTDMNTNALIDMQSNNKGALLPRVPLVRANLPNPLTAHVAGMVVYNTATSDGSVPTNDFLTPGYYWNDGSRWYSMKLATTRQWFFMPSIPFNTTNTLTNQYRDLYELYYEQFTGSDLTEVPDVTPSESRAGTLIYSTGAPNPVPYIPSRTELYYYITAYDPAVFSNLSIDANGIMKYDVTAAATDYTHINILFVIK